MHKTLIEFIKLSNDSTFVEKLENPDSQIYLGENWIKKCTFNLQIQKLTELFFKYHKIKNHFSCLYVVSV